MIGTGLKKCKPPNLSLRLTGSAIFSIDNDDVFDVNSAFLQNIKTSQRPYDTSGLAVVLGRVIVFDCYFGAIASRSLNSLCLASIFSTIASITRSAAFEPSANDVVVFKRCITSPIYFSPAFLTSIKAHLCENEWPKFINIEFKGHNN
jgi:hypothetical protein